MLWVNSQATPGIKASRFLYLIRWKIYLYLYLCQLQFPLQSSTSNFSSCTVMNTPIFYFFFIFYYYFFYLFFSEWVLIYIFKLISLNVRGRNSLPSDVSLFLLKTIWEAVWILLLFNNKSAGPLKSQGCVVRHYHFKVHLAQLLVNYRKILPLGL